jgi:DNA polymerase III epsilon subunit family exonuclease
MILQSDELLKCSYAAVDVETTGIFPQAHDRVIEIAVVRFHPDGSSDKSFVTLVNPDRDIGPTRIHGIKARDVKDAPRFKEISGDVLELLQGCVFVAHNAKFDWGFLHHEFGRAGVALPRIPSLCTLSIVGRVGN